MQPHQRHLALEDEVAQRGRREPALLAADMAMHVQAGRASIIEAPLRKHLIPGVAKNHPIRRMRRKQKSPLSHALARTR